MKSDKQTDTIRETQQDMYYFVTWWYCTFSIFKTAFKGYWTCPYYKQNFLTSFNTTNLQ